MDEVQVLIKSKLRDLRKQRKELDKQIRGFEVADEQFEKLMSDLPSRRGGSGRVMNSAGDGQIPAGHNPAPEMLDAVLRALRKAPKQGMLRSEITKKTGVISSTLSACIAILVKEGKIEQTNKPFRRSTRWVLTAQELRLHVGEGEIA